MSPADLMELINNLKPNTFDVSLTPAVTAGAYVAGDIVGGLMEIPAGRVAGGKVTLEGVQIMCKSAVTPTWTMHLFSADPSGSVKTDNGVFGVVAADAFKHVGALTGFTLADLGTPNVWKLSKIGEILTTDANRKFYALLVDGTGVTLGSVADIQVRFTGRQD